MFYLVSLSVYYACAKNLTSGDILIITFATRDVADLWFRRIADAVDAGKAQYAGIRRISPQFFVHNGAIMDRGICAAFDSQLFFTKTPEFSPSIMLEKPGRADHISGNGFFIRSVLQPDLFWFHDTYQGIVASAHARTKFTITITDAKGSAKRTGTIMVSSDQVVLKISNRNASIRVGSVHTQEARKLSVTSDDRLAALIPFSAFRHDFRIDFESHPERQSSPAGVLAYSPGDGEQWELA